MAEFAKEILPVNLEDEMRQSYLDYAMSVIVGRALPDVRDGLKPVHRRVLYSMHEQGNDWNKAYRKSARLVGDVMGKYHPHGDSAIYDSVVRMAQPFSLRYPLVDGQGNFGSVDGDPPAAMRYTEIRMARIAHELLADIDKDTVDFVPNYDETEREPSVLPTRLPNLLVNGSAGIAVGMATNIPPHNLGEVINACLALIDDPEIELPALMELVPAPDFPTAGIIMGTAGIHQAYATGRGRAVVRARTRIEEIGNHEAIVVTELPYQVNKARLLEKIAELVREKKIEGIAALRDESDKDGMRMVIEIKRGEMTDVVLNNLYQQTQLQTVFGINMVALVDGQPRTLALKDLLAQFIRHRREVVTRRTLHELRKARERAHILEGLAVALANIDAIIALIRASGSRAEAREALMGRDWVPGPVVALLERAGSEASRPDDLAAGLGLTANGYRLSEAQAQAILDLRLHQLTALESDKITGEYGDLLEKIAELLAILGDTDRLMQVIREELSAIREQFGDARHSEIQASSADFDIEDLIPEQDMVVTLSHAGYVKAQPVSEYTAQKRGGRGKAAASFKEEDFVDRLFVASSHDYVLLFSNHGKCYWLKVYQIPQARRTARGRPLVNLLPLAEGERISTSLAVREFDPDWFVFMATAQGTVKKTPLPDFSRPRRDGIIAIDLRDGDHLIGAALTDGHRDVMLFSDAGKVIRFSEADVRAMGRTAAGVRGLRLGEGDRVISLLIVDQGHVLTATANGYGKRTGIGAYPLRGRGGQGVISMNCSERNGAVVGAVLVGENDEVMLISDRGTLVRTRASEISIQGRNTQGVRLIALGEGETLCGIERVAETDEPQVEADLPAADPDQTAAPGDADPTDGSPTD